MFSWDLAHMQKIVERDTLSYLALGIFQKVENGGGFMIVLS